MKITINGTAKDLATALSLTALVGQCCKNPKHVIAELNGKIMPNTDWDKITVNDGDNLELVTFVGGG